MLSDVVELGQNLVGGEVFASAVGFVAGGQAAAYEFSLAVTMMDFVADGGFDEAGQGFAVAQDALGGFTQLRGDAKRGD